MRTNPIQTREGDIREVIKATFSTMIPRVWYACYQLPKYLMGNYQDILIPVKDDPSLAIKLCRSRLEVKFREELYVVDWECDPRSAQFSGFLLSSNWGSPSASQFLFPKVVTALALQMASVAQRI